jgi:hypothetical protein
VIVTEEPIHQIDSLKQKCQKKHIIKSNRLHGLDGIFRYLGACQVSDSRAYKLGPWFPVMSAVTENSVTIQNNDPAALLLLHA